MHFEFHKWYSHRVGREMGMLVIGHAGAKVLVFPTRDGDYGEYERLRIHHRLANKINHGELQLYCVDSIDYDSFYAKWMRPQDRIQRHMQYEEYILNEVLPFMSMKNNHECTISHGLSLGAFHATNIALRHPHLFRKLCAFSGRYDLTMNIEWFGDLFDGYYDENVYYHTPAHYLPQLNTDHHLYHLRRMDIVMVIGREDPFLENNRFISQTLWEKGIHNNLHEWDDRAHRGYYWRKMAPLYL